GVALAAGLRDQAGLHRAGRAEPDHRHAHGAQLMGHGQRREAVAAGTAGHQHDRARLGVFVHGAAHAKPPKVGSTREVPRPEAGVARGAVRTAAGRAATGDGAAGSSAAATGATASGRRRATWRSARSSSYDTRSSRPIAAQVIITLEPPEEISGRVRPLVGSRPRFTPTETKLCMPSHRPTPKAM